MNIAAKKQNIVRWIQGINDENVLKEVFDLKVKKENLSFENELIQKGLDDILSGAISSHEEVKMRFETKFKKK